MVSSRNRYSSESIRESVVAILAANSKKVVGTGFFVSNQIVLTCAHVVRFAKVSPGGTIWMRLHDNTELAALVEIEYWRDQDKEDVAILRLPNSLSSTVKTLSLGSSKNTEEHKLIAYGFPKDQESGMWGYGTINAPVPRNGYQLIQITSQEVTGGFSGSPVFSKNTGYVIGMVTERTKADIEEQKINGKIEYLPSGRLVNTAFATPSSVLREICPELTIKSTGEFASAKLLGGKKGLPEKGGNEVKETNRFHALLTHSKYLERMEQVAKPYQGTYKGDLAGRITVQENIIEYIESDAQVIVLHGAGGLGKTRLLLNLKDLLPSEISLWYVRNEAGSVESEITKLDRNYNHVIIIDDAHRCSFLHCFREVLINPELANKVTLVIATRTIFKETICYKLGASSIRELEIKPLENSDIDKLLQAKPYEISSIEIRHNLVRIAEGNPLIAIIAARLAQQGENLLYLSRDHLLTRYFEEILKDLSGGDLHDAQKYVCYLQVIAILGSIDIDDEEIITKLKEVLTLSPIDNLDIMLNRLVESGLIEQYGSIIMISSEVLGDRLLLMLLETKGSRKNSLWRQIIELFFAKKPKQILSNLARAELNGECTEARIFLGQKLDEFCRDLKQEGNLFRYTLLNLLEEVAYFRPDDILTIVSEIVDTPEPLLETTPHQSKANSITHEMILSKVVKVLEPTIYRGGIEGAIEYLHKLAIYQVDNQSYERVRSSAKSALQGIADFSPNKTYDVQFRFLEKISAWLEEDLYLNLPLSLAILHVMLKISFDWTTTDPIKPYRIIIQQGDLSIDEFLLQIRDQSLDILYKVYWKVPELQSRLNIVQELHGAIPKLNSRDDISNITSDCIRHDCIKTANFFLEITPNAELLILEKITDWLDWVKRFYKFQDDTLNSLKLLLQENERFQLYQLLVNGWKWDDEQKTFDREELTQLRNNRINEYVNNISLTSIDCTIQELETIVQQANEAGKNDIWRLGNLLETLGGKSPQIAQQFIDVSINKNSNLKIYLGFVLVGISFEEQEIAKQYIRSWVDSNDLSLWKAVAIRYHSIDWSQPDINEEENIIRQLVAKNIYELDLLILRCIQQMSSHKTERAIELLKILSTRNQEDILNQVANIVADVVAFERGNPKQWLIAFQNSQDLVDIVGNFERLSYLNHCVQICLGRLGEISPMRFIYFLERRILAKPNYCLQYEAFPSTFSTSLENMQNHSEFPAMLRYVRDWTLRQENYLLYRSAPFLLKALSPSLDGELYNCFMEWIQTKDIDKINSIANTLPRFNSGESFYKICREIILYAQQDEKSLSYITTAIFNTSGAILGGFSDFYKIRLKEIQPWLNDREFRIRKFANETKLSLIESIESQENREKLYERSWK